MIEAWKTVSGFDGLYEVSSLGRVRSKRGVRSTYVGHRGYVQVTLYKNSTAYPKKVHRLVAEAFLDNSLNKREVNHIDGNKLNNTVSNLEWVTPSENKIHAQRMGLSPKPPVRRGEDNLSSKLTDEQVKQIRADYRKGSREYGSTALAKKYGVSYRTILYIVSGEHW